MTRERAHEMPGGATEQVSVKDVAAKRTCAVTPEAGPAVIVSRANETLGDALFKAMEVGR